MSLSLEEHIIGPGDSAKLSYGITSGGCINVFTDWKNEYLYEDNFCNSSQVEVDISFVWHCKIVRPILVSQKVAWYFSYSS